MRALALAVAAAVLASVLAMPPNTSAQDPPATEGDLRISGYDADAVRSDDHRSLAVSETYFFNNSGRERFSGNITLWMQPSAFVSTTFCGGVRNQVVRVEVSTQITCFDLTAVDAEVFTVRPFDAGQYLSYFGENHTLSLNVTTTNTTANGQMRFNATIGPVQTTPGTATVGNLTLQASSVQFGAMATITWGPLRNLTLLQDVRIENTGGQDEVVDLALEDLPAGWTGAVRRSGQPVTRVSLAAGANLTVQLNVSAPSHLLHVFLEYTIQGAETSSGAYALTLQRLFPYNASYALIFLYTLKEDVVTATGGLETHQDPRWNETFGRYRYTVIGYNLVAGSVPTITITWVPPPFVMPLWAIAALAAIGAALVTYPLWQRRIRRKGTAEEASEAEAPPEAPAARPMNAQELRARRDVLRKTIERLKGEEEAGVLPEDLQSRLKLDAETELADIERRLGMLTTAEARKKQILKALRELDRDFKEGKVDKDVYASLKEKYEAEAVKVMRQVDEAKGKASGEEAGHELE